MIWLMAALAIVLAGLALRWLARALKPRPDSDERRCPHCGQTFQGERRYCVGCGGQIWDDVLSEN